MNELMKFPREFPNRLPERLEYKNTKRIPARNSKMTVSSWFTRTISAEILTWNSWRNYPSKSWSNYHFFRISSFQFFWKILWLALPAFLQKFSEIFLWISFWNFSGTFQEISLLYLLQISPTIPWRLLKWIHGRCAEDFIA